MEDENNLNEEIYKPFDISVNDTTLSKSILNKTYITTVPIAFKYFNGTVDYLTRWHNKQTINNPKIGDFNIQIPIGLKFTVTSVEYEFSVVGRHMKITCIILNDVPINENSLVAEAVIDRLSTSHSDWSYCTVGTSTNERLRSLLNEDKTILQIKNLKCRLAISDFYTQDGNNRYIWRRSDYDKPLLARPIISEYELSEDERSNFGLESDNKVHYSDICYEVDEVVI